MIALKHLICHDKMSNATKHPDESYFYLSLSFFSDMILDNRVVCLISKQVHMVMHLLIRDETDGILCPIPSHFLYTSSMALCGATLVCTSLLDRIESMSTRFYWLSICSKQDDICFLRYRITLTNQEVGPWVFRTWRSSWMVPDLRASLLGDLWL